MTHSKFIDHNSTKRKRISAYFVDLIAITTLAKSLTLELKRSIEVLTTELPFEFQDELFKNLPIMSTLVWISCYLSYFTICYYNLKGQTIGKMIFKIRAVSKCNIELSLKESFTRALGLIICQIPLMLPFAIALINKDGKGIADWMSNTSIKSIRPKSTVLKKSDLKLIKLPNKNAQQLSLFGQDDNKAA